MGHTIIKSPDLSGSLNGAGGTICVLFVHGRRTVGPRLGLEIIYFFKICEHFPCGFLLCLVVLLLSTLIKMNRYIYILYIKNPCNIFVLGPVW